MRSFGLVFFCKERGGGGGGGCVTWVTSSQVLSVLMKSCVFSRIFFLPSVGCWTVIIRPFSLFNSREQLSAYAEGDQPTPNADLESGQVCACRLFSRQRFGTTLVRPLGPDGAHFLSSRPASYSLRSKDLAGGFPVPPPPKEKGPFCTTPAHASSWTLLCTSSAALVMAWTGLRCSGPQHAFVSHLAGFFTCHVQHGLHDQRGLPTPSPSQAWLLANTLLSREPALVSAGLFHDLTFQAPWVQYGWCYTLGNLDVVHTAQNTW